MLDAARHFGLNFNPFVSPELDGEDAPVEGRRSNARWIDERIAAAGGPKGLFAPDALLMLSETAGTDRVRLRRLAGMALIEAAFERSDRVRGEHVRAAIGSTGFGLASRAAAAATPAPVAAVSRGPIFTRANLPIFGASAAAVVTVALLFMAPVLMHPAGIVAAHRTLPRRAPSPGPVRAAPAAAGSDDGDRWSPGESTMPPLADAVGQPYAASTGPSAVAAASRSARRSPIVGTPAPSHGSSMLADASPPSVIAPRSERPAPAQTARPAQAVEFAHEALSRDRTTPDTEAAKRAVPALAYAGRNASYSPAPVPGPDELGPPEIAPARDYADAAPREYADVAPADAPPPPMRVFVHFAPGDREVASDVARALERDGWRVAALREVPAYVQAPNTRFFYNRDAPAARALAHDLAEYLGRRTASRNFTGYPAPPPSGTVEVWLPSGLEEGD